MIMKTIARCMNPETGVKGRGNTPSSYYNATTVFIIVALSCMLYILLHHHHCPSDKILASSSSFWWKLWRWSRSATSTGPANYCFVSVSASQESQRNLKEIWKESQRNLRKKQLLPLSPLSPSEMTFFTILEKLGYPAFSSFPCLWPKISEVGRCKEINDQSQNQVDKHNLASSDFLIQY